MSASHARHPGSGRIRLPLALVAFGFAGWAFAQVAPPGFVASPEVYKVIAENDKYRVIEVSWKPGQKDQAHSHPDAAVYYLSDCHMRNQFAGRPVQEGNTFAGTARV